MIMLEKYIFSCYMPFSSCNCDFFCSSFWHYLLSVRCILFLLQQLLIASRNLEFFTNGYRYLIQILPAAVVAPMYFSGKIEFGVINQSVSAFNHILGDISLIVYQFQAISAFSAVIDRLGMFLMLLVYAFHYDQTDGIETYWKRTCFIIMRYSCNYIIIFYYY